MVTLFESPLLHSILDALPSRVELYLVGGAVRDALLGRTSYDLDFTLADDTLRVARLLADALGGAYYPLDAERQYARIVLPADVPGGAGERIKLDFATFQGGTLESDLRARDFTINAMALDLRHPDLLIDPLGGAADLAARRLRACTPDSLHNDPVRILRAVRQALSFELRILPETIQQMRDAVSGLSQPSPERIRDEFFRILDGSSPRTGIELLDRIGALPYLLPELPGLKGVEQSAPHIYDVWTHTLEVLNRLETVLDALAGPFNPDSASNLMLGLVSLRLGRFRAPLQDHLHALLNPDRSIRALLFLAALYHDAGKPAARQVDESGRIRFLEHDQIGEGLVEQRLRDLHLSNPEILRVRLIVRHHMRPFLLGQAGDLPTRRAVYRFFRDTAAAGVDICILSLADMLATNGPAQKQADWAHHLDVVRSLLEAWWERPEESVAPQALVDGKELMQILKLPPGPLIGRLLEEIREAQAMGQVTTRQEALSLARQINETLR